MMSAGSNRLTIFHKLFLFMLLVIVLFCGISIYINYLSEQDTKEEVVQSSIARMNMFMSSFTNDIERILNVQNQFVNDRDLLMLSNFADSMGDYEKEKSINDLRDRLFLFMSTSKYIDDISIQIPKISRVISINSSIDVLTDQDYKIMRSFKSSQGNIFLSRDNKLLINMPYPSITNAKSKHLFNLFISISKKEIKDTMKQIYTDKSGGCILIGMDNSWEVATDDAIASSVLQKLIKDGTDIFATKQWLRILRINSGTYWVAGYYSAELGVSAVVFMPENIVLGRLIKYKYWYLSLSAFSIVLIIIFAYWANKKFGSPMKRLVYAFKRVETGELAYTISHKSSDEFAYLYAQFNSMMHRIEQLIHQVYEQRIMMQQAELKQLQYQINPHFLYNTIYLIYRLASVDDNENVMRLSKHLGGYYKYITRSSSDTVPLKQEVAHVLDYVEVQSIRFSDRIKVDFGNIPEECMNILVPPLILQPVVENAYGHGLIEKDRDGIIRISFVKDGRHLFISIEDNGKGIEEEKLKSLQQEILTSGSIQNTTGLLNVHRRLSILYGGECGLDISRSAFGGLCVIIKIITERSD